MEHITFACPKCGAILPDSDTELECKSCNSSWPIVDEIPRFFNDEYYWGEIPRSLMQQINNESLSGNWQTVVKDLIETTYPDIYKYVIDQGRADFSYLAEIDGDKVILDIGSGWGTISCLLAERAKSVLSIEGVRERIEFTKIRATQDGLNNLIAVQASFLELPISENQFDLVVMNGVLEWIGIASKVKKPDQLQLDVLKKIHRSLRPGGAIYIGIENRFGYNYFLGARDHSDLPFTNLMPRWMANFVMNVKSKGSRRTEIIAGEYRTYTYSYFGYKSILRKAGFDKTKIYLVFPDYNQPAYLVPSSSNAIFRYVVDELYSGATVKKTAIKNGAKLLSYFGLHKYFSPCYAILAYKD